MPTGISWPFETFWDICSWLIEAKEMLKASASWGEWGAHVCQVSSASHFLLFLHAVISMAFLQTGHRLLPNLLQICTLTKKVSARIVALGTHRKVLRVFIKGITSNWTPAPSNILFCLSISGNFPRPFPSKDLAVSAFFLPSYWLLSSCISFCVLHSLFQAGLFKLKFCCNFSYWQLRILQSIPNALSKFFPKERLIFSLRGKWTIIMGIIAFDNLLWWSYTF